MMGVEMTRPDEGSRRDTLRDVIGFSEEHSAMSAEGTNLRYGHSTAGQCDLLQEYDSAGEASELAVLRHAASKSSPSTASA